MRLQNGGKNAAAGPKNRGEYAIVRCKGEPHSLYSGVIHIEIRKMWKDGEATRVLPGCITVTYHDRGEVFCHHPDTGEAHPMANGGLKQTARPSKSGVPPSFRASPVHLPCGPRAPHSLGDGPPHLYPDRSE